MSNAIITLFVVAILMVAILSFTEISLNTLDSGAQSWKQTVDTAEEVLRTDIDVLGANNTAPYIEVLVQNSGKIRIGEFSKWDVIVQYYGGNSTYSISSLTYTENTSPSNDQWTVATIYSNDSQSAEEAYEPGIVNPGEVMLMNLNLASTPQGNLTNWVTVSSPNGVVASAEIQG